MEYTLFIFRRDLRLRDNKGLKFCIDNYDNIIPIFIFTPEQISYKNKYKSDNAIQFMIESLKELDNELKKNKSKLHLYHGKNITVLKKIIKEINIKHIVFNMDYTPYAQKRDKKIEKLCKKNKITCDMIEDYLLADIGSILKKDGKPYLIYTPFKNKGFTVKIDKPSKYKLTKLKKIKSDSEYPKHKINPDILVHGGRKNGLKQLKKIKTQKKYNDTRNDLSIETTLLSAYIKFGCLSIREVYWKFISLVGKNNGLVAQLFWREFYYYIVYYFPQVLKGKNFNTKYDDLEWNKNMKNFMKWCNGNTGYPVIDAGMRQMNKTGYMHNRARLITANFMNRMLGMDWRLGEKYYAKMLTDYDPSVNNGNWQWIASTGVDPKPYFQRLFNPWLQSKKFDSDAKYIKTWLPQLKDIPAEELHQWDNHYHKYDLYQIDYFKPVVNYKTARKKSIEMYRKVL